MVLLTVTFELWCSSFIFVLWHLIGMISRPKIEMLLTVTFELWYFDVIVHLWSFSWICAQQIPNWLSFAYKHPNLGNRSQQSRRKCSLYCDISLTILLYNPFLVLRCARIREQDGDRCAKGEAPAVSSTRSSQHKAAGVLEALVTLDRKWPHPKLAVQHVGGTRGVVLLQHGDRRQPVGAPGGLLVQAGHLPQQAQGQHAASRSEQYHQTSVHCRMRREGQCFVRCKSIPKPIFLINNTYWLLSIFTFPSILLYLQNNIE